MAWKQKDRTIAIKTVLHTALDDENTDDVLLLRSVTTKEAVSRPFPWQRRERGRARPDRG